VQSGEISAFELIELTHRAREFLLLDVHENQKNLVASVAQSFSDALFPPEDPNGPPLVWIRGVLRNSQPAGFVMCVDQTEQQKGINATILEVKIGSHEKITCDPASSFQFCFGTWKLDCDDYDSMVDS